jgi:preprotein translocase SecE subunit
VDGKESSKASGSSALSRYNYIGMGIQFLRDAVSELKKVYRPTRQETTQATMVVFAMIFGFAVFLGLIDFLLGKIMQSILT